MSIQRPNPEKLLRQVEEEEQKSIRGKLKIYLGAAPGVGKTYKMLEDAIEERNKGIDVIIGVVESHGRQEIDEMIKNFEILPRRVIEYHGKPLYEFAIEEALKRNPGVILVDEMAHTNPDESRHKKRWQDIKELLDRGIDVYTTLNVQHIESLNDYASQIIHAPVKETVPDHMLEIADAIELVDLPPEELLIRLREGKIYIPEQAEIALGHFFQKGNLIALRELALRATAERVGEQVLVYRHAKGIRHIWPTKEKILVCVGHRDESLKLIRAARRMAAGLQADWIAVHVERPAVNLASNKRDVAIKNLRFAEELGAETHVLVGFNIVKEILNFAREKNVTQIMVWKHIRNRWRDFLMPSLADEMVRNSGEIDVYLMTGEKPQLATKESAPKRQPSIPWRTYWFAIGAIILITIINSFLYSFAEPNNLIMMYLLGVTLVSLYGQTGPSLLASVLSVLAYSFFFVPPFYSIAIYRFETFLTLIIMLTVAQVISQLSILIQRQTEAARLIEKQTSTLYTLSSQLATTRGISSLLDVGVTYLSLIFNSEVLALMPKNNRLIVSSSSNVKTTLNEKEMSIAKWVFDMGQIAGRGTDTLPFSEALYVPLLTLKKEVIGVLRIQPSQADTLVAPDQLRLLESCCTQIALALEVDRLSENKK